MTTDDRPVPAGRVGKAHGLDGSFYLREPGVELAVGDQVLLGDRPATVERVAGTPERPLVRVSGIADRNAAEAARGETLLATGPREVLDEDQWYDDDLVGCEVPGVGTVNAVIHAPSCDLLEVGDEAVLVPLIRDAVTSVDLERRVIEIDRRFLALDES